MLSEKDKQELISILNVHENSHWNHPRFDQDQAGRIREAIESMKTLEDFVNKNMETEE